MSIFTLVLVSKLPYRASAKRDYGWPPVDPWDKNFAGVVKHAKVRM